MRPPLIPNDVDLTGFKTMPLDVVLLRESTFAATVSGDEYRAGTMLWCASWHQIPAGSVPSDDVNLAKLAGYGFAVDVWRKLRAGALRGFVLCSDGRLYHAFVSEIAWPVWLERLRYFHAAECDRIRKHNARVKTSGGQLLPEPTLVSHVRRGYPATARHLDALDQLGPPAGWLPFLAGKKKRGKKVCPPDNFPFPADKDDIEDGENDLSSGRGAETPHDLLIRPPENALKRKEEEELPPLVPPPGGSAPAGFSDSSEGSRGGDWEQDIEFMAFIAAGGKDWAGARLDRAFKIWLELAAERPPIAKLTSAVSAYFAWRLGRGGKAPTPVGPTTFLRSRHWRRFEQPDTTLDPAVMAWRAAMATRWPAIDLAALVRAGLREVEAQAWFGGIFVDVGPPRRLMAQRSFEAKWVEETYRHTALRRLAMAEGWEIEQLLIVVEAAP